MPPFHRCWITDSHGRARRRSCQRAPWRQSQKRRACCRGRPCRLSWVQNFRHEIFGLDRLPTFPTYPQFSPRSRPLNPIGQKKILPARASASARLPLTRVFGPHQTLGPRTFYRTESGWPTGGWRRSGLRFQPLRRRRKRTISIRLADHRTYLGF
jgi:hypothetical protein